MLLAKSEEEHRIIGLGACSAYRVNFRIGLSYFYSSAYNWTAYNLYCPRGELRPCNNERSRLLVLIVSSLPPLLSKSGSRGIPRSHQRWRLDWITIA